MPALPTNELFTNLLFVAHGIRGRELGVDLWMLVGYNGCGAWEEEIWWERQHRGVVP